MRKGKPLKSRRKSSPAMQAYTSAVKKGMENYHVVKNGDGWVVKKAGAARASGSCSTQKQAEEKGRELARRSGTELFIHGRNGRIRERNTY